MHLDDIDGLFGEVQRKIGRNILLFQQLEYLLKYIVANGQYSGYFSELEVILANSAPTVHKQTMGQLVGQFVEYTNPARNDCSNEPDKLEEAHFSFNFRIDTNENSYKEQKENLSRLVLERNNLVHHLIPELDIASFDSCKKVEKDLDDQADRVRLEIENFRAFANFISDARKELSDYLSTDEGKKSFYLSFIRQDRLVILLAEIASQTVREDGWTLLNTAGQLLKQYAPDELALLHKGAEHKSLKSLMLKAEMFEFKEEKTDNGGIRVLYKLQDE